MNSINLKSALINFKNNILSNKKLLLIVLIGFLGMLLLMVSELKEPKAVTESVSASDVEVQITKQLTELLEKINGAGRVEVMITFESSQESVFASDKDENIDSEVNRGEERKTKSEHIIIKNSDGETGLKVKDIYPQIRGVAIVCDGGGDPVIKGQIISMISALFNINSTKISVAKMAD